MRIILSGAAALVWLAGVATPAAAQNDESNWAACSGEDDEYSRPAQIAGCTALIDGGRQTSRNTAVAFYNRGIVYYRDKNYRRAIADFDQAIAHDAEYSNAYRMRGDSLDEIGEYRRAIADYSEAIRLNPQDSVAYALRGYTYDVRLHDYESAIADYDRSLELNPQNAGAFNNRGRAYYNQRKFSQAVDDFSDAIRLAPEYGTAYRNRGDAYDELGDYDRAIEDYDQAIRLDPRDAAAFALRGYTYRRRQDFPHAIADYRESVRLYPTASGWDGLCWTIVMEGRDMAAARTACDAGLAMEPNHASLRDSRGMVSLRQRRYQDAWNDYDAAARADPRNQARYIYGRGLAAIGLGRTEEGQADRARALRMNANAGAVFKTFGVDQ